MIVGLLVQFHDERHCDEELASGPQHALGLDQCAIRAGDVLESCVW